MNHNIRVPVIIKILPALLFLQFFLPAIPASTQTKPNIIYIMSDDMGYADLSCYGKKEYHTPNLDKLASQGMKFLNAYAASAVCTPTRAAFMTGRYPARTTVGLFEPLRGNSKDSLVGLSPDQTSIASLLKSVGYETILIGKWHLGFKPEFSPNKNGFDEFFGFHAGGIDYVSHENRGKPDLYENETLVKKEGYLTDLFRQKAIDFIKRPHAKPFFFFFSFNATHWPWQAPGDKPYPPGKPWQDGGSSEIYARMVQSMDNAIGEIMGVLDEMKLSNNTIIIFTNDNGGEKFSDMGIYRGMKGELLEGGIKVPAFIRWDGKIPAHSTTEQVACTFDWTATILSAAGTKPNPKLPLDGVDLMPVCMGKKTSFSRTLFWRMAQEDQYKAVRDGDWKYLKDEKGEYLFDLSKDPGEKNDLKEKQKDIFESLKSKYATWEKSVLSPVPLN